MSGSSSDRVFDAVTQRVPEQVTSITPLEWIVLLGVTLLAVLFVVGAGIFPDGSAGRTLITAVGTGLLVSAVFSFIQRMVVGRVERRAQARYLAAFSAELTQELRMQVAQLRADAPTHDFPGTEKPDLRFNRVLIQDLREAAYYWFRGYTARYVAARLRHGAAKTCQVYVILPDPREPTSLNLRLSYLNQAGRGDGTDQEVREKISRDLRVGILGLFLARRQVSSIELIMTRTPGLDRVELFDSAVWVTLFSGRGESNEFPHTLRYPSTSIWHETQISECTRTRREAAVERYELSPDMTETEFRALYAQITGDTVTEESWENLKRDYKRFEGEYRAAVGVDGDRDAGGG